MLSFTRKSTFIVWMRGTSIVYDANPSEIPRNVFLLVRSSV